MMYAHSTNGPQQSWQLLASHLQNVAELSAKYAFVFGAEEWGRFTGLLHDLGKASDAFQKRLAGASIRVDHATAGGQLAFDLMNGSGDFLPALAAFPVLGHHGGLPDGGYAADIGATRTVHARRRKKIEDFSCWRQLLDFSELPHKALPQQIAHAPEEEQGFATAFFIRMLYSCLVDADWLDTERFCNPERFDLRPNCPSMEAIASQFSAFAAEHLQGGRRGNPDIQQWRQNIQGWCREAGKKPRGAFSLTVPTGGGKTFSSLAFALKHAREHSMSRVIYVIPFTSIIEQNAAEFRRALGPLGESAVLEHHSSVQEPDPDAADSLNEKDAASVSDMRLAAENWDAPLVVTTAVQFFESLFARTSSRCRKLHNIANSVIVLDEAQMLPTPLLAPCVMALRELVRGYGASVVLCTATQPSLSYRPDVLECGFEPDEITEIIPSIALPELFAAFRRVSILNAGTLSNDAVAERLRESRQGMVIVNTREAARRIFECLGRQEGHYHLSAAMHPEHRRSQLFVIRQRLKNGEVCRVVSTTLIEAGVDIDFPVVYREATGIDSIAQAAGRCNREGLLRQGGMVFVYTPEKPSRAPFVRRRALAARHVLETYADILAPEAITAYFDRLYAMENLDSEQILTKLDEALLDDDLLQLPAIPFAEVANAMRFITDDTVSVIVECAEALDLLVRLEATDDHDAARRILRALQAYTVQVYANAVPHMHVRPMPRFGLYILSGGTGYDPDLGLVPAEPDLRRAEDNIF